MVDQNIVDLGTIKTLLEYSDWSNRSLLKCALETNDVQLDRDMQIGPGTLRRTLMHIYNGEHVWLERWRGNPETRWPSEAERLSVEQIKERFEVCWQLRNGFVNGLKPEALPCEQIYRDSKGHLFKAALGDMLLQGCLHSKHHQAQAVNILRRLGAPWPELDYMMRLRKPADS